MKYCVNCRQQMNEADVVCPSCGSQQQVMMQQQPQMQQPMQQSMPGYPQQPPAQGFPQQPQYQNMQQPYMDPNQANPAGQNSVSWGWVILGFLIPIAGWICWGIWRKTRPATANACGIAGIIGFCLNFFLLM